MLKGLQEALETDEAVAKEEMAGIYSALFDNVVGLHSTLDPDLVRLTLHRAFRQHGAGIPSECVEAVRAFKEKRRRSRTS